MRASWIARLNTLNDIQGGLFGSTVGLFIEDLYDRANEKGHQNGFTPYESRIVAVYPLPFGKNQKYDSNLNRVLRAIVGDWTLAPEWRDRNGARFTPGFSGVDTANVGRARGLPDLLPGCNPNSGGETQFKWNAGCFAIPPNGRFGTAPRGMMRGFYTWGINLNAFKHWHLGYGERGPYFQLEAYFRNILKHPNRGGPSSTNITSPAFGQFRLGGSRNIQIRLRIGIWSLPAASGSRLRPAAFFCPKGLSAQRVDRFDTGSAGFLYWICGCYPNSNPVLTR